MTRVGRGLAMLVVVSLAWGIVGACAVFSNEESERFGYLDRSRGPYQGRVIDAETKEPIAGAVVLAIWRRDKVYPLQMNKEFYVGREVLTGRDGRFRMEAHDIESGAPRRTFLPEFVIYSPGYGWFPSYHVQPKGPTGGKLFEGDGVTVELPLLKTRDDRLRALRRVDPGIKYQHIPSLLSKACRKVCGHSGFPCAALLVHDPNDHKTLHQSGRYTLSSSVVIHDSFTAV